MNKPDKPNIKMKCPFCGGIFEAHTQGYFILHSIPPCEQFARMGAVTFLKAVNAALEKSPTEVH